MATGRVKVYEDGKRGGIPVWAWLLPLLILLGLLAWFLLRHHATPTDAANSAPAAARAPAAATAGMPDLGAVHFATDQAALTPEGQAALQQAAVYMKQNPTVHLRVEGYTDSTGTDPHNETLSQRRAATVEQFLQGQGIDKSRLTGEGFGPEAPVATNATSAAKADNRPAELIQHQYSGCPTTVTTRYHRYTKSDRKESVMKTIVGLYKSVDEANKVKTALSSEGFSADKITVIDQTPASYSTGYENENPEHASLGGKIKHFFSSLSGSDEQAHESYSQGITNGGALLAVTVADEQAEQVADLLYSHGATDIEGGYGEGGYGKGGYAASTQTADSASDVAFLENG